ncbi:MAG: hypothetical protein ACE5Q6_22280 [Dehalococcoidia bacterium]
MTYFKLLIMLHVLFVALYVGSSAGLGILWSRNRQGTPEERLPDVEAMLAISKRFGVLASSLVLLVGILMLINQPAMLGWGALFYLKIILGFVMIGFTHVAHARLIRLQSALAGGTASPSGEKMMDLTRWLLPVLGVIVIILGVWHGHA